MKNRYGAKRTVETRPVLPVIEIVCDDTRTAVAYFEVLKREAAGKKVVKVIPASSNGATASDVIKLARTPNPSEQEPDDDVFVLADLDTNPNIRIAHDQAAAKQVKLLVSKPCFEVWTLAHLLDTGEAFSDCDAVLASVKRKWKDQFGSEMGKKAQAKYENLMPLRQLAIDRSKQRRPDIDQSWTEVWRAVEAILR
jgi:hypothetical protein